MFQTYFGFGFTHLLDVQAYDHLLFLAVLCAGCGHDRPRELLVLVTAFTAGHSASLALATLQLVRVPAAWVEFLVLATIVGGAAINLATRPARTAAAESGQGRARLRGQARPGDRHNNHPAKDPRGLRYATTVLFGLVHGLGFSNFLSAALGAERSLLVPLLSFNLGLEAAQVVVVAALSLLGFAAARTLRVPPRAWATGLSVASGAVAAIGAVQRWPL